MSALRTHVSPRTLLAGLLGCMLSIDSPAQNAALFAVPTESHLTQPLAADAPWRIALQAPDLAALAKDLRVSPPAAGEKTLEYTLEGYPQLPDGTARSWLESSFVIDYQEPDVVKLYQALRESAGPRASPQQLVDFVSGKMTASLGRAFAVASQIARTPTGDCKEYAVLTAALARSAGVPARVVVGLALLERDGHYGAFGHAWTEVREGNRWVVADSATHHFTEVVRYLPFGIMEDEGPGFEMTLARLSPAWVERVTILGEGKASARAP